MPNYQTLVQNSCGGLEVWNALPPTKEWQGERQRAPHGFSRWHLYSTVCNGTASGCGFWGLSPRVNTQIHNVYMHSLGGFFLMLAGVFVSRFFTLISEINIAQLLPVESKNRLEKPGQPVQGYLKFGVLTFPKSLLQGGLSQVNGASAGGPHEPWRGLRPL